MCYPNFVAWNNWNFGIWGAQTASVRVTGLRAANNGIAVHFGVGGPDSLSHKYADKSFRLDNSLIFGFSGAVDDPHACSEHMRPPKKDMWAFSASRPRTGLMLATFTKAYSHKIPFKKPWIATQSAYQALWGKGVVDGVSLVGLALVVA